MGLAGDTHSSGAPDWTSGRRDPVSKCCQFQMSLLRMTRASSRVLVEPFYMSSTFGLLVWSMAVG